MEKIVSRREVGSSNPFVKFFRELAASVKGIATGILFIIISFVIIWFSVNQVEHSATIEELPLQTPAEVVGVDGMVKIHAVPDYSNVMVAPNTNKEVLYYTSVKEDYAIREVTKTRTIEEDGKTIEETYIEYKPDWKTVDTETKWSEFSLGSIAIDPGKAKLQMNTETLYEKTEDLDFNEWLSDERLVDVPQKTRVTITGVTADQEIIVVGVNSGDRISTGGEDGTFFLSNKSESEFVADQAKAESTAWWIKVILAWFLMTTGFTMLFGPITKILDLLPGVGSLVGSLLFIIFGIISAVILFIAYIGMKFWWLILLGIIVLIGVIVLMKVRKNPKMVHIAETKKK